MKTKEILKNIGGGLLGAAIISPVFFLPYIYAELYFLVSYIVGFIYFYMDWREDYWANYADLFKLCAVLIVLEVFYITPHYNTYGLDSFPRFIISTVDSIAKGILILYGLYLWIFKKAKPKKTWGELTDAESLRQYVAQAKLWGEITNALGEQEKIDVRFFLVWGAYAEMKRRGKVELLLRLLENKYEAVKFFAARNLLWTHEREALSALREIRTGNDEVAKMADDVIKEWEVKEMPLDSVLFARWWKKT